MSKKKLFYIHGWNEVPGEVFESLNTFNGEVVLVKYFPGVVEVLEPAHVIIDTRFGIDGNDAANIAKQAYELTNHDGRYHELYSLILLPCFVIPNFVDIGRLPKHTAQCAMTDSEKSEYSHFQRSEVKRYIHLPVGLKGLPKYQVGAPEEIHKCLEQGFVGRNHNGTVTVWKAEPYENGFGLMEIRNFTEHFAAQIEYCPFCAEKLGVLAPVEEGTATFTTFSLQ